MKLQASNEFMMEVLESVGLISAQQAHDILTRAQRESRSVIDVASDPQNGPIVCKADMIKAVSNQLAMDTISLEHMTVDGFDLRASQLISKDVALKLMVIPLYVSEFGLAIGIDNPFDLQKLDTVRKLVSVPVESAVVMATEQEIRLAIECIYAAAACPTADLDRPLTEATLRALKESANSSSSSSVQTDQPPPKIFISYSHDSASHLKWVAHLATTLRANGVDAVLDQWDLEPGADITSFMENGLVSADKVLVVCTPEYVRKANEGRGGVGYERMIVSAEILKDLGTTKFIPVIRKSTADSSVPLLLATRLYLDFCDDDAFDEQMQLLLRVVHRIPPDKPGLGKNPFA